MNEIKENEEITIQVNSEELNIIWLWLWKLPYEQSYKLIAKLIQQYNNYKSDKSDKSDKSITNK